MARSEDPRSPRYGEAFNPKPSGTPVNPHVREAIVDKPVDYDALKRLVPGPARPKTPDKDSD